MTEESPPGTRPELFADVLTVQWPAQATVAANHGKLGKLTQKQHSSQICNQADRRILSPPPPAPIHFPPSLILAQLKVPLGWKPW